MKQESRRGSFLMLIFIALASLVLFAGCDSSLSVSTPEKSIQKSDNYVFVEGRWKEKSGHSANKIIPRINFTNINCSKESMRCKETEALLWSPKENKLHPGSLLYTQSFDYIITEWTSEDVIKAERRPPVADIEIKISLKDDFAEKSYRETKARGSETADANMYGHWVLD